MHTYLINGDIGICHILSTSSVTENLCSCTRLPYVCTPREEIQLLSYVDITFTVFSVLSLIPGIQAAFQRERRPASQPALLLLYLS